MTDIEKLNEAIENSGIKKKKLCEALNLSYPSLQARLNGEIELTANEISIFCSLLGINEARRRDQIFFAIK